MNPHATKRLLAIALSLALAGPAAAGVRYTAVTDGSDGGRGSVLVEAEGDGIRIEFQDRGDAMFGKGDYLVSADGGATVYWVEPKKRRYAQVDFERLARMFGRVLEGIPGVFWVRIEEPQVYRLFEEEVPSRFGLPTWHVRYLMTYRERSRVTLPAKHGATSTRDETWNHVVQDLWFTDAVAAPGPDFWLRERFRSGYQDLDRLLAAENRLVEGFPLRVETVKVASTRDLEHSRVRLSSDGDSVTREFYFGGGSPRKDIEYTRTTTEITAFETTADPIPTARFLPPEGFTRREPKG